MIGFLLTILARLMSIVLIPIGLIYSLFRTDLKTYYWNMAIALDQLGNVCLESLMNDLLIQEWSNNNFGNPDETISSVLGKNQLDGTLKPLGKNLVLLLGKLDNNHSIKSIERDEKFRTN